MRGRNIFLAGLLAVLVSSGYFEGLTVSAETENLSCCLPDSTCSYLEEIGFGCEEFTVKTALDFSGNSYIVGENSVSGYFVYSVTDGIVLEYSLSAQSPYGGYSSSLIYGGPACYFVQSDDGYVSLMDGSIYAPGAIGAYEVYTGDEEEQASAVTENSLAYTSNVDHPEFFSDECSYACGYSSGGHCGFIGLGMLIGYADKYKEDDLMDDDFYAEPETKTGLANEAEDGSAGAISEYLYDLNPKETTTSMHIKNTMNLYAEERGLDISYYSRWIPFYSVSSIYDAIEANIPVELFGNFTYVFNDDIDSGGSTGNHAVVAYGARFTGAGSYYWRCHLGWRGYGDVEINSGVIGSVYYFDV